MLSGGQRVCEMDRAARERRGQKGNEEIQEPASGIGWAARRPTFEVCGGGAVATAGLSCSMV
jgi:hypothetical protein